MLRLLHCRSLHAELSLHWDDAATSCTSGSYSALGAVAVLLTVIYGAGVPSLLMLVLYKNRKRLQAAPPAARFVLGPPGSAQPDAPRSKKFKPSWLDGDKDMYRILCADYKERFYYFEIVDMMRKWLFLGWLLFLERGQTAQLFTGTLVAFGWFALHAWLRVYKRPDDNLLRGCADAQLFVVLLTSLLLRTRGKEATGSYDGFLLLLGAGLTPCALGIMLARHSVRRLYRVFCARRSMSSVQNIREEDSPSSVAVELVTGGKRARKADWKLVDRGGKPKWTKTYRVSASGELIAAYDPAPSAENGQALWLRSRRVVVLTDSSCLSALALALALVLVLVLVRVRVRVLVLVPVLRRSGLVALDVSGVHYVFTRACTNRIPERVSLMPKRSKNKPMSAFYLFFLGQDVVYVISKGTIHIELAILFIKFFMICSLQSMLALKNLRCSRSATSNGSRKK